MVDVERNMDTGALLKDVSKPVDQSYSTDVPSGPALHIGTSLNQKSTVAKHSVDDDENISNDEKLNSPKSVGSNEPSSPTVRVQSEPVVCELNNSFNRQSVNVTTPKQTSIIDLTDQHAFQGTAKSQSKQTEVKQVTSSKPVELPSDIQGLLNSLLPDTAPSTNFPTLSDLLPNKTANVVDVFSSLTPVQSASAKQISRTSSSSFPMNMTSFSSTLSSLNDINQITRLLTSQSNILSSSASLFIPPPPPNLQELLTKVLLPMQPTPSQKDRSVDPVPGKAPALEDQLSNFLFKQPQLDKSGRTSSTAVPAASSLTTASSSQQKIIDDLLKVMLNPTPLTAPSSLQSIPETKRRSPLFPNFEKKSCSPFDINTASPLSNEIMSFSPPSMHDSDSPSESGLVQTDNSTKSEKPRQELSNWLSATKNVTPTNNETEKSLPVVKAGKEEKVRLWLFIF